MLTPDYVSKAPSELLKQFKNMEEEIIKDVARSVKKTGQITATSNYQLGLMYDIGWTGKKINTILDKELTQYGTTAEEALKKSAQFAMDSDFKIYEKATGETIYNKEPSPFMNHIIKDVSTGAKDDIIKLNKTTGFLFDGKFIMKEDYLRVMLNKSSFLISSGAFTYEQIARKYIKELGDKGIRVFDFASGQTREMETHLKRIMVDATRQLSNRISVRNAEDLGTDLMEISAHEGARPSHQEWQGEIMSLSGQKGYLSPGDIGEGDVDGFGGANCRHTYYPYFEGSTRNYTKSELQEYQDHTKDYDGKTYTDYDATQRQRAMERGIRQSQRRMVGLQELGDGEAFVAEQARLTKKVQEYKQFSDGVNLKTRADNTRIYMKTPFKAPALKPVVKPTNTPRAINKGFKAPTGTAQGQTSTPIFSTQYKGYTDGKTLATSWDKNFQTWRGGLSPAELDSVRHYTASGYDSINPVLRKNQGDYSALAGRTAEETTTELTEAINKFDLKEDIRSYRNAGPNSFKGGLDMIGKPYTDDGFVSTTPVNGSFYRDSVEFVIDVPKGTGWGAYVDPISSHKGENEFILQRGTQLLIKDVEIMPNGSKKVWGEVIGNAKKTENLMEEEGRVKYK